MVSSVPQICLAKKSGQSAFSSIVYWVGKFLRRHDCTPPKSSRLLFLPVVWASPSRTCQWLNVLDQGGTETTKNWELYHPRQFSISCAPFMSDTVHAFCLGALSILKKSSCTQNSNAVKQLPLVGSSRSKISTRTDRKLLSPQTSPQTDECYWHFPPNRMCLHWT